MDKLDVSYFMKTKSQANDFSTRLSKIIAHLYETDFNLEKELLDEFGIQKKDKIMTLLRTNEVNIDKVDVLKVFLLKMQDTIAHLPVLDITIAFEPKEKTLQDMTEWFIMNIKRQMLLNITLNTDIIGGAQLGFNGKYFDASIKPAFEKALKETEHPQ